MNGQYTKVTLINKKDRLSKQEKSNILYYANNFICGAIVTDQEKNFLMEMKHVENDVFEVSKGVWQNLQFGNVRYLQTVYSHLIKLK